MPDNEDAVYNPHEDAGWSASAGSDKGCVREVNEDALLSRLDDAFWVVADGMGGHEAGDKASKMIVEELAALQLPPLMSDAVDVIEDALIAVNQRIRKYAAEEYKGRMMGSTVVSLYCQNGLGVALWAGDSRLYRLRDGELKQLSRDHSQHNDLIERGLAHEGDETKNGHVITRAVGAAPDLFLDVVLIKLEIGDTYILCSDGLTGELPDEEIRDLVSSCKVEACAEVLIERVIERGARDNVTVVVANYE